MSILASVCLASKHRGLTKWFLLQCTRQGLTLRVSAKGEKSSPRPVFRFGKRDNEIRNFLRKRREVREIMREVG